MNIVALLWELLLVGAILPTIIPYPLVDGSVQERVAQVRAALE